MIVSWNLLIAAAVVSVTASANTNPLSCYKISISTFCLESYNTTSLETAEQELAATFLSHFQPIYCSNSSSLSRIFICANYCHFVSICLPSLSFLDAMCSTVQSSCIHLFKVSWYPKIDHVFEKYTSVIFR